MIGNPKGMGGDARWVAAIAIVLISGPHRISPTVQNLISNRQPSLPCLVRQPDAV